jgi:hypothetical protein
MTNTSNKSTDAAYMAVKARQAEIEAATSQAVVPAPSSQVSEALALHVGTSFAAPALRPEPEESRHLLAWRTGLLPTRSIEGKMLPNYAGWAIQVPEASEETGELSADDGLLAELLESLCEPDADGRRLGAPIVIQHRGDEKSGNKPRFVRYVALRQASLYVVCQGIPSNSQMAASAENRWGIAYGWPKGGKSALRFQVFVRELLDAGYFLPLQCSFHGPMTGHVLSMLRAQYKVLAFADKSRRAIIGEGAPMLPYYAYDLPTTVSEGPRQFGKGNETQNVYVPVPVIPVGLSLDYLASHATPELYARLIEDEGRVEHATAWSIGVSKKILEGVEGEEGPDGDAGLPQMETPF